MDIITEKGDRFDLINSSVDFKLTNPVTSKTGSQSLSIALPPTSNNLAIIGNVHIGTNASRPVKRINVRIRHGLFQETGTFVINSISSVGGIQGAIYIREAVFYEKIKKVKMPDLEYGGIRQGVGDNEPARVLWWANELDYTMRGNRPNADYCVFPLCLDYNFADQYTDGVGHIVIPENYSAFFLNETLPIAEGFEDRLLALNARTINVNGTTMTVPVGYGATPFLKLHVIVRYMCEHFGYILQDNIFTLYDSLVLLNNTADPICKGFLNYKHLVPDVEVEKFLLFLENKFNIVFVPDEVRKEMRIVSMENVFTTENWSDWNGKISGPLVFLPDERRQLQLTANKDFAEVAPNFESYQQFLAAFPDVIWVPQTEAQINTPESENLIYVYRLADGRYYEKRTIGSGISLSLVNKGFFDYDAEIEGVEKDVRNGDDQIAPLIRTHHGINMGAARMSELMPFFQTTARNVTTAVQTVNKDGNVELKKENEVKNPISLCNRIGQYGSAYPFSGMWLGSPYPYDGDGIRKGFLSLTYVENFSITDSSWRNTRDWILNSNIRVSAKVNLTVADIAGIDMTKLVRLDGQILMLEEIKVRFLPGDKIEVNEVTFRTLKKYL